MDFHCPSFVQTSEHIGVGGRITPVSTYKGKQVEVTLLLFQDPRMRNWWLFYDTKPIGYWPGSLFTELRDGNANVAVFGGYVWGPMHDPPEMGSGHFANEREGKAAYARNIKRVNMRNTLADLDFAKTFAYSTKPPCYTVDSYNHNGNGVHVYYGEPGDCHPYPSVR
ncbi:hypothetical protein BRADI_4g12630v3 [Brachypodium distachyon]|uniref:Neprosin PEP catalytic domain-containing protein n=2 Tax=Brachypodium distachyon TaxID=15368 RepID=I1IK29_BRADI|nr:hypothetical protein BRADI_4g12630v3 [Brachypodium distachyon]